MKLKTLFTLLVLSLFPLVCSAELLIYKGAAKTKIAGGFNKFDTRGRLYWVHNASNGITTQIYYENRAGGKYYRVSDVATRSGTVNSINGISFTLLSQIKSGNDTNGIFSAQSVWIKGRNTTLKTSSSTTKSFARILIFQAKDMQIVTVDGQDQPAVAEASGTSVFMSSETIAANDAGETHAQAIARLTARLDALGYTLGGPPYVPAE